MISLVRDSIPTYNEKRESLGIFLEHMAVEVALRFPQGLH